MKRFAADKDKAVVVVPLVVRMGIVAIEPQPVLIAIQVEDIRVAIRVRIMCQMPSIITAR